MGLQLLASSLLKQTNENMKKKKICQHCKKKLKYLKIYACAMKRPRTCFFIDIKVHCCEYSFFFINEICI